MKKTICMLVLSILLTPLICFSVDTGADRVKAAKELKKAMNLGGNTREAILEAVMKNYPEEQRKKIKEIYDKNLNVAYLEHTEIETLASVFTVEELNAMTTLYSSEAGKSAMAKFPQFFAKYQYAIRDEMSRIMKILQKELN